MDMLTIRVDAQSYPVLDLPGRPRALLDYTVAEIYGVETKHINQALKNNPQKFPPDFFFQLTHYEQQEVVKIFDHLYNMKYSRYLPNAFSIYGCNMLSTILKSEVAVRRCVQIVRGFTANVNVNDF